MPNKRTTIKIPTLHCQLVIVVTDDVNAEVNRVYKKYKSPMRLDDPVEGVFFSIDIDRYYLVIERKYLTYNTIAHEVFHATIRITKDRGIKEEESQAWLCGYLNAVIHKFLHKKNFVIKHG